MMRQAWFDSAHHDRHSERSRRATTHHLQYAITRFLGDSQHTQTNRMEKRIIEKSRHGHHHFVEKINRPVDLRRGKRFRAHELAEHEPARNAQRVEIGVMNDAQASVFEQAAEICFAIAAEMPCVLVKRRKEPLKRRNDENAPNPSSRRMPGSLSVTPQVPVRFSGRIRVCSA